MLEERTQVPASAGKEAVPVGDHQADEVAQLLDIQRRTRELLRRHPALRAEFAKAFDRCVDQHCASTKRQPAQECVRALERLRLGELGLVPGEPLEDWECVYFRGLCEKQLDQSIRDALRVPPPSGDGEDIDGDAGILIRRDAPPWTAALQDQYRAAAMKAAKWFIRYQSPQTSDEEGEAMAVEYRQRLENGGDVERRWHVWVPRAGDDKQWCHLSEVDPGKLRHLPEAELLERAMFHLGGLADLRSLRPVVPEPGAIDGDVFSFSKQLWYEQRLPGGEPGEDGDGRSPSPQKLPPDVAEQFLELLMGWNEQDRPDQERPSAATLPTDVATTGPQRAKRVAERPHPTGGSGWDIALDSQQWTILRRLYRRPQDWWQIPDIIAAGGDLHRDTVRKHLGVLKKLGFVVQSEESQRPWRLTAEGIQFAREHLRAETPTK